MEELAGCALRGSRRAVHPPLLGRGLRVEERDLHWQICMDDYEKMVNVAVGVRGH